MARHGQELAAEMRAVGKAVVDGSKSPLGLAVVVGVAVLRDSSKLLPDTSIVGRARRTLVGYSDRPTGLQPIVYLATLTLIFSLMKLLAPPPPARTAGAHS